MDKTRVCNIALARMVSTVVTNVDTDTSDEAILCKTFWQSAIETVLELIDWTFARKRAGLAQDATWINEDGEFAYRYLLPSDCLKVRRVNPGGTEPTFVIEGRYLYTNEEEVFIRYTFLQTDVTTWSPGFCNCVAIQLDVFMSARLLNDKGNHRIESLKELQRYLPIASSLDIRSDKQVSNQGSTDWTKVGR